MRDTSKLPKWAQELVASQTQRIEELQEALDLATNNSATNALSGVYELTNGHNVQIRDRGRVEFGRFKDDGKLKLGSRITVHYDKSTDELYVYGDTMVEILPRSGNHLIVKVKN